MRSFTLAIGALLLTACGASSPSDLRHEFGKTRRVPLSALEPCRQEQAETPTIQAAQDYVSKLAHLIMNRNPQTFAGDYAPEKFCFTVLDLDIVNALAFANKRLIVFNQGMLEALPNDGHVAAVLAHELAHITMQHTGDYESETVTNDPRWQAHGQDAKEKLKRLERTQQDLESRKSALYVEHSALEAAMDATTSPSRQLRAELAKTYQTLLSELYSALGTKRSDSVAFLALATALQSPTPRLQLAPSLTKGDVSSAADFQILRDKVERYRTSRDAWLAQEEQEQPDLWTKYRAVVLEAATVAQRLADGITERERLTAQLNALRTEIIGDAAANWHEQEADEVGLEFHLRAGFAPLAYQGLFEVLHAIYQSGAASCAAQAESPERGAESHPDPCWRYYNAKALEMSGHSADYAPFLDTDLVTEIFPGELDALKKAFSQAKKR